jgi:hypothetical protein
MGGRRMKVVISACYGGFGLSDVEITRYFEIKGTPIPDKFWDRDIPRDDPALVQIVQEIPREQGYRFADLKIVEIPDDVQWQIEEYDGKEWVAEKHRTWS